jgi:hypothetical protein
MLSMKAMIALMALEGKRRIRRRKRPGLPAALGAAQTRGRVGRGVGYSRVFDVDSDFSRHFFVKRFDNPEEYRLTGFRRRFEEQIAGALRNAAKATANLVRRLAGAGFFYGLGPPQRTRGI